MRKCERQCVSFVDFQEIIGIIVGRCLESRKHVVRTYDYVDSQVLMLMLARMYARRLKGYGAIGYRIGAAAADGPSSLH